MAETEYDSSEVLALASKAGRILLENGAEISRVEETMERIAAHYGESKENFFVLSNGIFTTGKSYSHVEYIPIKGARMDKVAEVNQLSRSIQAENLTTAEADKALDCIDTKPAKPLWEQLLATAVGCAGFCIIFGGSLLDCAAAAVAGLAMYSLVLTACARLSKPLSNICGGFLGTILCILFQHLGFGANLGNMIIGTIIPLIPGVAFTNGLRDIANEDYLAGTTRLLDALMVFFCIAIGVCLSFILHSWTAGGMIQLNGTVTDPVTALIPIQLLAAFAGTTAFAVLFSVQRAQYVAAGIVGMLGWLVYLLIVRFIGLTVVGGTFFATVCVALLSRKLAVIRKCPSTVFLICGIFPLIPGAGVFWSSYYLVANSLNSALHSGLTAVEVTIAIVLGIIIVTNILHRRKKS